MSFDANTDELTNINLNLHNSINSINSTNAIVTVMKQPKSTQKTGKTPTISSKMNDYRKVRTINTNRLIDDNVF